MIESNLSTILIVDDMPENVSVLFDFLNGHDFEVLVARNGKSALRIVESAQPHLVLLDVMMPEMDGFEVCRQLKKEMGYVDLPVIFMTALSDTVDKVHGFALGAVDYITKPFQQEEVLARIHTHLSLFKLQKKLRMQNEELAFKNADLDAFASTVAHDLKTPLNAIIGLSEVLLKVYPEGLSDKQTECIDLIAQSGHKMTDIINALLLLATISKQEVCLRPLDMANIVVQVKLRLMPMLAQTEAKLIMPDHWPLTLGYAQWVEEVWANYLSNALKYGGHPPCVTIKCETRHQDVLFWVEDNGPGLPKESQEQLFKPFSRLSRDKLSKIQGHGLGLSIVKRIVQKLGGDVGVESEEGKGSRFYFSLPRADTL